MRAEGNAGHNDDHAGSDIDSSGSESALSVATISSQDSELNLKRPTMQPPPPAGPGVHRPHPPPAAYANGGYTPGPSSGAAYGGQPPAGLPPAQGTGHNYHTGAALVHQSIQPGGHPNR